MKGVVVAFSGGVDSSLLLFTAVEALGERTLAVIGHSPIHPLREHTEALNFADHVGARYRVVETDELTDHEFRVNPPNRCYICKKAIMGAMKTIAVEEGFDYVVEGSNVDDLGDYRPGMDALRELGIRSPLVEAGLTKQEIREISRERSLPTWDRPSMACLASRIPYGEKITKERLSRIEQAEEAILRLGIRQLRVRDVGDTARIEVEPHDIIRLADPSMRGRVVATLKELGYRYVCLDLDGYRTGSMNETLAPD